MSTAFEHICIVDLPVGHEGGEDTVDVEVKLNCRHWEGDADTGFVAEIEAEPVGFRYPALGSKEWIKFSLGTLDGDGYIYSLADDWIEENEAELFCAFKAHCDREDDIRAEYLDETRHRYMEDRA